MAPNARHIAVVAASTALSNEQSACKNSKYFQTRVVPQLWQYARCVSVLAISSSFFSTITFNIPYSFLSICYTFSTKVAGGQRQIMAVPFFAVRLAVRFECNENGIANSEMPLVKV